MYIQDPDNSMGGIEGQEGLFWHQRDIMEHLFDWLASLDADIAIGQVVTDYFDDYLTPVFDAARAGDEIKAIRLVRDGDGVADDVNTDLDGYVNAIITIADYGAYPQLFQRYSLLRDIEVGMMNARRIVNRAAMYMHDPDDPIGAIMHQQELLQRQRQDMLGYFWEYNKSVINDPYHPDARIDDVLRELTILEDHIHLYIDFYATKIIGAAKAGDEVDMIRTVREAVATISEINQQLDSFHQMTYQLIEAILLD